MAMSLRDILRTLAHGEFRSGEAIAKELGVSRTAIWKHLVHVEALGIALERKAGQGYRIVGGLELLDSEAIQLRMNHDAREILGCIVVLDRIDSTNRYASAELARHRGWLAVLAESQTAGRGRLGRAWISPYASNLYLSLGCRFAAGLPLFQGMSLAVGAIVCRVLSRLGVRGLGLKWPNDILLNGKKLGGILTEISGDPLGECEVVVGIGINTKMPAEAGGQIDQPWADLRTYRVSRNRLAADMLSELVPALRDFPSTTFARYREEWQRYDAYANSRVWVSNGRNVVEGLARGVTPSGALRVETESGELEFSGGEISLRPLS